MRILLIFTMFLLSPSFVLAQPQNDSKLAQQYYADGEFEKAAVLYEKLHKKNNKTIITLTDTWIVCWL